MKTYFLDTNVILRFLLKDHPTHSPQALQYFQQAEAAKIKLILISEVVIEVEYVLRKVYKHDKKSLMFNLNAIVSNKFIEVRNRDVLLNALSLFTAKPIDLVDAFLLSCAEQENVEVLSFDKDFTKIAQRARL